MPKIVPKYLRGEIWAFRYADDVLFCFHYRSDALKFLAALRKRLAKFGLRLNEAKTKLCRFGRFAERDRRERGEARATFPFLGFTFYNRVSRQGKYTVGMKTAGKRLRGCMTQLPQWCKENRHQAVDWQARYLNAVLRGHYYYYGVTGNFRAVAAFYRPTVRQSNETDRRGHITKQGRKRLRTLAMRAVLVMARTGTSPLVEFYRLKKRQKGAGKAFCATARKLLSLLFVMLTKALDYWYVEDRLYNRKLRVLQKAAQSQHLSTTEGLVFYRRDSRT